MQLEEVFKQSGLPGVTFVEPPQYPQLLAAMRVPGHGIVVEGPSGVGKTSAVTRAVEKVYGTVPTLSLSARKSKDIEFIHALPDMPDAGVVIIDDFHRLDVHARESIANYLKILADEEVLSTKLIVVGINRAGESLLSLAPDLLGRISIFHLGANPDNYIRRLIELGSDALNITMPAKDEIVNEASGSFNVAQMLCFDACVLAGIEETCEDAVVLDVEFGDVLRQTVDGLGASYMRRTETFAKGKKLRREGRAPYLQILKWLAQNGQPTIDLEYEASKHREAQASVNQVVQKGHLAALLKETGFDDLLHFDEEAAVLAVEDPKYLFFLRNVDWNQLAQKLGFHNLSFPGKYDFAISFARDDRDIAELIAKEMSDRECSVFYDRNEQAEILAENVKGYLAPIYQREATFVLAVMGQTYYERVWSQFEAQEFGHRFGERAVIPIWIDGAASGAFDRSREVGGLSIDRAQKLDDQISAIGEVLSAKIREYRRLQAIEVGQG